VTAASSFSNITLASVLLQFSVRLDFAVTALEFFYPSCRIDKTLSPGKERMTLGANRYTEIGNGRARLIRRATRTGNSRFDVFWMNIRSHDDAPQYAIASTYKQ
jgi:hypothetical protein